MFSRNFVRVGSLLFWRGANFDIARANLSALCACRIALVVAWCEFDIIPATLAALCACQIAGAPCGFL